MEIAEDGFGARSGQRGHVERLPYAGPSAADRALSAESATVVVERSETGKRGDGLGRDATQFRQLGKQDGSGDGPDAGDRAEQCCIVCEWRRGAHELGDRVVQLGDRLIEPGEMRVERLVLQRIVQFAAPGALLLAHRDELVAPPAERGQRTAGGIIGWAGARRKALTELGEPARIDRIGLGPLARCARQVARSVPS